jgi:hypothetical protein
VIAEGSDTEVIDAQELQEPPHLESPLMTLDEIVEHALTDSGDNSDGDTSMWDSGLDDNNDEDTSIQGPESVGTHGLSDTVIQPGHKRTLGVTGSIVVGSIHSHRMLPGGTVVDSGILGAAIVRNNE